MEMTLYHYNIDGPNLAWQSASPARHLWTCGHWILVPFRPVAPLHQVKNLKDTLEATLEVSKKKKQLNGYTNTKNTTMTLLTILPYRHRYQNGGMEMTLYHYNTNGPSLVAWQNASPARH
jgi:hypothetical protein